MPGVLLCALALSGCHNRAHNDLYVENMAAEIRDLEDQLYEYDHEYRALEQKLESLRHENESLRAGSIPDSSSRRRSPTSPPLEFQPRIGESQLVPDPQVESILEPAAPAQPNRGGAGSESIGSESVPASPFRSNNDGSLPPPRTGSPPSNVIPPDIDPTEIDPDSLVPPTIEPGEPMPPQVPVYLEGLNASHQNSENELELNLSRIEVPAQLAGESAGGQATITLATEKVKDRRVVELAFHPSLSRAANFDDRSDDDGLYLVLQPRNESGQMVPDAADLTVVVLDPAREGNAARIGRWDYSANEVKNKMQPIGSNQGIHLTLPWNGPDPSADRVIVFAKYTFENGRQVIGQKEIFVSSDGGLKTVWAPRGSSGVVPASATQPIAPKVIRPAQGTSSYDPAPVPQ